jgi:hypothetical protein
MLPHTVTPCACKSTSRRSVPITASLWTIDGEGVALELRVVERGNSGEQIVKRYLDRWAGALHDGSEHLHEEGVCWIYSGSDPQIVKIRYARSGKLHRIFF